MMTVGGRWFVSRLGPAAATYGRYLPTRGAATAAVQSEVRGETGEIPLRETSGDDFWPCFAYYRLRLTEMATKNACGAPGEISPRVANST